MISFRDPIHEHSVCWFSMMVPKSFLNESTKTVKLYKIHMFKRQFKPHSFLSLKCTYKFRLPRTPEGDKIENPLGQPTIS
ncbi:hypothetical protein HanRHA438_Chr11g0487251 [Helianthus annuus]|nr:hypothetical protein HanRHA438_Chr11g0487251 [Helianthus annuus]